jgi:uncharacterized damage-inducible protein DinB
MRTCLLVCLCALPALAENPLTDAVTGAYHGAKRNLIEAAEAMPENSYSYKLTPAQRTFAEWIAHTAQGNYFFCSAIRGAAPPGEAKSIQGLSSKADLQKALTDSFAYCDSALQGMDDKQALTEITMGGRKAYPVTSMVRLVGSLNEHYGNIVGYLRSKGITPPSSARGGAGKKK